MNKEQAKTDKAIDIAFKEEVGKCVVCGKKKETLGRICWDCREYHS